MTTIITVLVILFGWQTKLCNLPQYTVWCTILKHVSLVLNISLILFHNMSVLYTHTPYQVAQLGEKRFENPQTANLHQILVDCLTIHELMVEREREGEGEEEGAGRRRRKSTREKLVSATNQARYHFPWWECLVAFMGRGLVCDHFKKAWGEGLHANCRQNSTTIACSKSV